jgi:hypothetical protein
MVNSRKILSSSSINITDTTVIIDATSQNVTATLPKLSDVPSGTSIYIIAISGTNTAKIKTFSGDLIIFEKESTYNTTLYPIDTFIKGGELIAMDSNYWFFMPVQMNGWIFNNS